MKFSYNWIGEMVEGLDCAPGPLERLITMKTAECEGIEPVAELLAGACAAWVDSVEPIAGGHNLKAVVETGRYGRKTVVCGALNCRPGMVTAYAPIGKKMFLDVESDGMLASASELGINKDHGGIIELEAAAGAPIPGCAPDSVIEIDNKSITHRPDLWGHHGMAREVAAILGRKLKDPVKLDLLPSGPGAIKVQIEDFHLCPRYSAQVFENLDTKPSPFWLQARLMAVDLNPISNIVDMTNFVMAELAQPMHAFDADLIQGDTIYIRPAKSGERFQALNGERYTLEPSNLVIADARGAIALAGVIGGMDTSISAKTRRVVLESACFQASSVRKTSAAIKLRTDASMRFEKAQDPANTVRGIARAIELLHEIAPGMRTVGGVADQRREAPPPAPIDLPLDWLERKLGRRIAAAEVRQILERLEFGVEEPARGMFRVSVPSWRATKDISITDDLVEEVGRMVGYDSITPTAPLVPSSVPPGNEERHFQHDVRGLFVDLGFTEVHNYSFLSEEAVRAFGLDPAAHVRVTNPIASDQALMRTSLLPGIWHNIGENAKHRDAFRLFEIGLEIHRAADASALPDEVPHLVAAIYDRAGDGAAGLFEAKRAAECLMPGARVMPAEERAFEHPARSAAVKWKGERIGRLFELHPSMVEVGRAAVLDLDLGLVRKLSAGETKYAPIRRYPSSAFDLSVVAGARELAGKLEAAIASLAGPLLESVEFVRQYSGPPLAEGTKSVSFRVTVGSAERT
ncbi:MAG TPA: phenylalanine--tRNA ligase subunit beta, partial [Candidatus Sulfopaludibacter sp.]|nr:phenylalanine--tRNA ligase subunit beta [Candidatus Sulfopaludibacter sp.]